MIVATGVFIATAEKALVGIEPAIGAKVTVLHSGKELAVSTLTEAGGTNISTLSVIVVESGSFATDVDLTC